MPLYNTREPTLLESPGRARGSVPGAVQGLPAACVVASTNRDRALLPPPPPSFLSRSFVIRLAIYPYYSYPPRSYHVSLYDGRYVDTRNRTQRRNGIFRCERYSSRIEKETERNGTSLGHVERRPRRKREREREEIVATVKRGRGVGYT